MHQVADRGCVFRGTDGIVAHHAFETLHGPRSMEGENFVEKGFAVGKGACLMHKPAARSMKGPFVGTGIEDRGCIEGCDADPLCVDKCCVECVCVCGVSLMQE